MKVNDKGEVTLPKDVLEAAGIRAGDSVNVRARTGGGVIIEKEGGQPERDDYRRTLEDMARRKPFKGFSTKELMEFTRGEG